MDENNHRNMKGKENEKCSSGDLWICSGGDPERNLKRKRNVLKIVVKLILSC